MSENSTNSTIENELEAEMTEEIIDHFAVDSIEDASEDTIPIYEQAELGEGTSLAAESIYDQAGVVEEVNTNSKSTSEKTEAVKENSTKKKSIKDLFLFAQNTIFTPKVCNIIFISLGSLMTALSLMQMVFWGLNIKDTYSRYIGAFSAHDYINIFIMAFMALFVLILFINTIKSIVSLIKKEHEPCFEMVSTMFSFYLFATFVTELFGESGLLISNFKFAPTLGIMIGLVLIYAVIKLFVEDFASRIYPLSFICGAIVLSIVMFSQNVGDFAFYSIAGAPIFRLSDLNAFQYLRSVAEIFSSDLAFPTLESAFLISGATIDFGNPDFDRASILIFLQFVPIVVSTLLSYVSISLFGYLMVGLVRKNYMQYHILQSCKKISISMLVVSIFSIAATVGLYFVCKATNSLLAVQFNYTNMVLTILLCVAMIVVTALPWTIYNRSYKRRYAAYKQSKGGN